MAVVPFVSRFTPTDIGDFYQLAAPRLRQGIWSGVARQSGDTFDRLMIFSCNGVHPAFTLERDGRGNYYLYRHRGEQQTCQLRSTTALDCLALLRTCGTPGGGGRVHVGPGGVSLEDRQDI